MCITYWVVLLTGYVYYLLGSITYWVCVLLTGYVYYLLGMCITYWVCVSLTVYVYCLLGMCITFAHLILYISLYIPSYAWYFFICVSGKVFANF